VNDHDDYGVCQFLDVRSLLNFPKLIQKNVGEVLDDIKHVGWCDLMKATFKHNNMTSLTLIQNKISCAHINQIIVMEIIVILWAGWISIN